MKPNNRNLGNELQPGVGSNKMESNYNLGSSNGVGGLTANSNFQVRPVHTEGDELHLASDNRFTQIPKSKINFKQPQMPNPGESNPYVEAIGSS